MPVALVLGGPRPRRVPLVGDPVRIGRGSEAEIVVPDERAAQVHALVRVQKGEYVLAGAAGESVFVNGKRVPVMALRSGDEIHLVDPTLGEATTFCFEDRMDGAFVPPGASRAAAWMAHPAFRTEPGPERYGSGVRLGGRDPARCRIVREPGTARRLLVKVLGPVRSPEEGDLHLALLAALAGANHPALVPVVDGGLANAADGPARWTATAWVEGTCARDLLTDGVPFDPVAALRLMRDLTAAVAHLHARGVVHRDVTPANVIVDARGAGVLIDPGHAFLASASRPPAAGVVGTPGYVAPEAVLGSGTPLTPSIDVYGLAATGYALFTGRSPAAGADVLEVLAQAGATPTRPRDLGIEIPGELEGVLLEGLSAEPRARPTARKLERSLAFAEAALGLGGGR